MTLLASLLIPSLAATTASASTDAEWGFIPRLVDADGEPVEGALVTVANADGELAETTTGENGNGDTLAVPDEGDYVLTFDTSAIDASFDGGDVYAVARTLGEANTLPVQRVIVTLEETANDGEVALGEDGEIDTNTSTGSSTGSASVTFDQFLQQLASGLNLGIVLTLATLGLGLVFATTGLTNFAHGEQVTIGALAAYVGTTLMSLPLALAAVFAAGVGAVAGWAQNAAIWKPLRKRGVAIVSAMIASIGIALMLRFTFAAFFGSTTKRVSLEQSERWSLGPVAFPASTWIGAAAAAVVVGLVGWWLMRSSTGRAARAVAANRALASATGVNVEKTISSIWIVSGAITALSGVLFALLNGVSWDMGFKALLLIFAAMLLGGPGTARGALAGGLAVGLLTEILVLWLPSDMKYVGALAILIVVLMVRPQGIFGRAERVG
ncbi:branched-chain amino acid ABC transporter permease [Demequina flava]|uniref:branched-chain amino acid ABC transporter permease n=1 Tax=Demequina flava TaxID=1095025 RepID=UPI0007828BE2|nr:branched-chain amino acid ABC transporter permease [Demequina flava]